MSNVIQCDACQTVVRESPTRRLSGEDVILTVSDGYTEEHACSPACLATLAAKYAERVRR